MSRNKVPITRRLATSTFLAFSICGAITGSLNEARSTLELYQRSAQSSHIEYVQGGQSIYAGTENDEADSSDEVTPVSTVMAFCMTRFSIVVRKGCPVTSLFRKLDGFNYAVAGARRHEDVVSTLIIERPTNPFELEELVTALRQHAFIYAFDDGSGYFHEGNTYLGLSNA